jgi:farnesyl-diphosphate farnesyltransferase
MNAIGQKIEHPSGKGRGDENFPVGSWLIRSDLRRHVHVFYRFARNADDIADAEDLPPAAKLKRLDRMAAVLDGDPGEDSPSASAMRVSLMETDLSATHCHELLQAFRQDAVKSRYSDWTDLMAYCRLSAAPVGRYLLDLHGESRDSWPASDALCAALQVINHVQDCAEDYKRLDRVYLPLDLMATAEIGPSALAASASSAGLRRVIDQILDLTRPLVVKARALPSHVESPGLRRECSIIAALAEKLLLLLAEKDPLAQKVKLGKAGVAGAIIIGLLREMMGTRL